MRKIIIDESYSGKRLDRFLIAYFKNCSKNYIYKLLRLKKIKVNGKKVDAKYTLLKNDEVQFYILDTQFESMLKGEKVDVGIKNKIIENLNNNVTNDNKEYFLNIIYEDDSTLILQKPFDMVVIEDENEKKWVMTNFVRDYLSDRDQSNKISDETNDLNDDSEKILANFKPSAVHRIDRNTSGLVIFAKKYSSFVDLVAIFKKRKIEKEYLAIVIGKLSISKRIEIKISKDEEGNIVRVDGEKNKFDSKTAITNIEPIIITEEATLVRATIETGRTHQIRVTLAETGHPIINDIKYGQKKQFERFASKYNIDTMLLLAYSLKFENDLPSSISNLNGLRIKANMPYFWQDILKKHFNLSVNKLEELLKNLRK
ncbi:MAG: RluA family pseudouridine synthase [Spirochaetota bacterium]